MKHLTILLATLCCYSLLYSQQNSKLDEAIKLFEVKELGKAKLIFEELYAADEENPQVNYYLGRIVLAEKNYDDAIDYFDVAIEVDGKNAEYYFWLGNAYNIKNQQGSIFTKMFSAPKMKTNWEKAVQLDANHIAAQISVFYYYLQAPAVAGGNEKKAKKIAEKFIAKEEALGHCFMAECLWDDDKDWNNTIAEVNESMKMDTTYKYYSTVVNMNAGLLNKIGYYYLGKDNYDKSKEVFEQVIDLNPKNANAYDSMGDYYIARENFDSALVYFEKAIETNPKFVSSIFKKGEMLEKLGRRDKAVAVYKQLAADMPDNSYGKKAQDRLDDLGQ